VAESLDTPVADSDRATAADELRQHYDSGRLTLEEFENRFSEVHTAPAIRNPCTIPLPPEFSA